MSETSMSLDIFLWKRYNRMVRVETMAGRLPEKTKNGEQYEK